MNRPNLFQTGRKSLLIALLSLTLSTTVLSQKETDRELAEAEKQVKLAQAKQAIAEAKKAELAAKLPDVDSSKLVGSTTIKDGKFIETEMLGYCAMKSTANEITSQIRLSQSIPAGSTFIIYNKPDAEMVFRYRVMMNRLKTLEIAFNKVPLTNTGTARTTYRNFNIGAAATAIAPIALDVLTLLKTDIEITPSEISIGEKALVSELFQRLAGYKLYYPDRIPMSYQECNDTSNVSDCSPLIDQLILTNKAHQKANEINQLLQLSIKLIGETKVEVDALKSQLDELITKRAGRKKIDAKIAEINNAEKRLAKAHALKSVVEAEVDALNRDFGLNTLNAIYDSAIEELGLKKKENGPKDDKRPDDKNEDKPGNEATQTTNVNVSVENGKEKDNNESGAGNGKSLTNYVLAEKLYSLMSKSNTFWLDIEVIKSGGSVRSKTNFLTNFFTSSRVTFNGGAIVYLNVFGADDTSKLSGTFPVYRDYLKSKEINGKCK
jgi:hypothetical protein